MIHLRNEILRQFNAGTPVRYIRDWATGTNYDAGKYWIEIMAYDQSGSNVALNKSVQTSTPHAPWAKPPYVVTNGITSAVLGGDYCGLYDGHYTPQNVLIDLNDIYNITKIVVYKYFDAQYHYHTGTKTEISTDGINWTTIFDSAISGTYPETSAGKTHLLV